MLCLWVRVLLLLRFRGLAVLKVRRVSNVSSCPLFLSEIRVRCVILWDTARYGFLTALLVLSVTKWLIVLVTWDLTRVKLDEIATFRGHL